MHHSIARRHQRTPRPARARGVLAVGVVAALACSTPRLQPGEDTATAGQPGAAPATGGPAMEELPIAPVAVELDRTQYASGGTLNLRLVNRSAETFGYNPCTRTIEVRENGRWRAVLEPDRICTMELRLLGPRETAMATTELPDTIADGDFRLAIRLTPEGAPTDSVPRGAMRAVSATFRVR
jgi:hypothetical protein